MSVVHNCSMRKMIFHIKCILLDCSVMNLLAEIYSQEKMIPRMHGTGSAEEKQEFDLNDMDNNDSIKERTDLQENPYMLSNLAPRLWPFMRHSITSVRHSAIRTLVRFLLRLVLFMCANTLLISVSLNFLEFHWKATSLIF